MLSVYTPQSYEIIHKTSVDFVDRDYFDTPIHLVQYDNELPVIEVSLFQNGKEFLIPDNIDAELRWKKPAPSRRISQKPVLGKSSDSKKIYFTVTRQMCLIPGNVHAILQLFDSGGAKVVGSSAIPIVIERNPIEDGDVEDSSEVKSLLDYVAQAERAADKALRYEASAQESAGTAAIHDQSAQEHEEAAKRYADNAKESVEIAKQYSGKPAIPSETNKWMIWDVDQQTYVETEFRSLLRWDLSYPSVAEMEADLANQSINTVAIIASNTEDEDNAKIYIRDPAKWRYLADLSGFPGPEGPIGKTGPEGPQGPQGASPTVSITKVGKVSTITITDAEGPHITTLRDGEAAVPDHLIVGSESTGIGTRGILDADTLEGHNSEYFTQYTDGRIQEIAGAITVTTDRTPTLGSENPVQSGGVYDALQNVNAATLEGHPANYFTQYTDSQIEEALDVGPAPMIDPTPTKDSADPVQSGGVYDALQKKPNPNLLINPYFVGGGSQKINYETGEIGLFPINQRGKTEYSSLSSSGYTIDRWLLAGTTGQLTIEEDGLTLTQWMSQKVEALSPYPVGMTLTVSLLTDRGLDTATFTVTSTSMQTEQNTSSGVWLRIQNWDDILGVTILNANGLKLKAVKLELGTEQTLAHQDENGTWVLNEIPDYTTELLKCQRYYIPFAPTLVELEQWNRDDKYPITDEDVQQDNSNKYPMTYHFIVTSPVEMRTKPTFVQVKEYTAMMWGFYVSVLGNGTGPKLSKVTSGYEINEGFFVPPSAPAASNFTVGDSAKGQQWFVISSDAYHSGYMYSKLTVPSVAGQEQPKELRIAVESGLYTMKPSFFNGIYGLDAEL